MTISPRTRQNGTYMLGALAGLSLIGTLAGCSAGATTGSPSAGNDSSSTDSSSTATTSGTYKDGTYNSDGTYTSPGGTEKINVALTLKDNVVTAVTVKTVTADPTATQYENQFIGGINAVVVGKKLDELKVDRVAGSSLTSNGFNDAVTAIKADAAS